MGQATQLATDRRSETQTTHRLLFLCVPQGENTPQSPDRGQDEIFQQGAKHEFFD
jgi:hypothetical protein